jgi:tetratricopeptide (TPR) repeat protein
MRLHRLYISLLVLFAQPSFADAVLERAEALINQKKIIQAYDLLAPLEDERAGQPDYDYLYGLSLLEAGDPSRAAFAFERCLGADPNNGPCRVQMARTHLALGETISSRKELDTIKQYNPPPAIQSLVDQYLGMTQKVEAEKKRQIRSYLKVSAGHDTNINGATENSRIALPPVSNQPVFLIVPHRQSSAFAHLDLGSAINYQINPDLVASLEGNIDYRAIFNNPEFDYYTANVGVGALKNLGNTALQGKLQWQKMGLDGQDYRDVLGALVQIQHPLANNGQVAAFTQLSQLRYDTQSARDADRTTLGIAYSQAFEQRFNPSFYASLYQGQESTTNSQFDYFSQSFKGVRVGGGMAYNANLSLNSHISLEQRDYDKGNQFLVAPFNTARQDDETQFNLGVTWRFKPQYSLQPYYNYSRTSANQAINDYTRHVFGLDLRILL